MLVKLKPPNITKYIESQDKDSVYKVIIRIYAAYLTLT